MKKLILFCVFITFIPFSCIKLYCQSNIVKGNDINQLIQDDSEEDPSFVKIHTPLGHEPADKKHSISTSTWTETEVEKSKQKWLYSGGVFKTTGGGEPYQEKNNYIPKNSVLCMSINDDNIYIGTREGIYISTDYGDTWLDPDDDDLDNLEGREVYAILINSNVIYLGTDNGIYKSTNSGETWGDPRLSSQKITCLEYGENGHLFAGAEISYPGVYKSTDNGSSWSITSLTVDVFSLIYDSGVLYAGVEYGQGLKKSTDGGGSWSQSLWFEDNVTSILVDGTNIYIGTGQKGCWRSTNGGQNFSDISGGTANHLPKDNSGQYYKINSMVKFDNMLFVATDFGLYKSSLTPPLTWTWSDCGIKGSYDTKELLTKMLLINDADLWIACDENLHNYYYPSASVLYNLPEPFNPTNFPRYNCHGFAWHLSERGVSGTALSNPNVMNYIPEDLNEQNWDYIKTTWNDPLWDKVTYGDTDSHSGIKSPNNDPNETVENNLKIISKWTNTGPLVEHKLRENPWGYNNETVKYWKSKKKISGDIIENQEIGRQIITDGSTTISDGNSAEFRIAPMNDHKIHLTSGFHAEKGSYFHAFVDNSRSIPWEEHVTDFMDNIFVTRHDSMLFQEMNPNAELSLKVKKPAGITKPCSLNTKWQYSGKGSGTEEDPYQITNIYEFQEITRDDKGYNYWILMNDIDASETHKWNRYVDFKGDTLYEGFIPLSRPIKSLDGRGHVIRNLYVNNPFILVKAHCLHLKRLGFENITIERFNGGIIVHSTNDSNSVIEECFITGKYKVHPPIDIPLQSNHMVLGFGEYRKDAIVRNCYTDLTIEADTTITYFAEVYGSAKVTNCYAAGKPVGQYVNPPFFTRLNQGEIRACFYDNETIKVTTNIIDRGIGLPTSEMKKREPFEKAGWDFENVWYIDEGMDYPKLRAFKKELSTEKENRIIDFILNVSQSTDANNYKVQYGMPYPSSVEIALYNSLGSPVRILLNNNYHQEGTHTLNFDGSALSSGVYFIVMRANQEILTQKIIIIN